MALCPVHPDKNRSLSIDRGKGPHPFVIECMSWHCDRTSIIKAMGLTWRDIDGDRAVTPEIRQRLADQERLKCLETRWGAYELLSVIGWEGHDFWVYQASKTDYEIASLKAKMDVR